MQPRSARILVIAASLLAAVSARAQDLENGKQIARVWCSNCHLIDREERKVTRDAVPTFSSIAHAKSTTEESLATFLSMPHGGMPDLTLSRAQIQDLCAYILSLRKSR
jgi:mono/diheme cytochrome c family protein